jgi:ribosomal 50S subunit-recycling heat shock protein
MRIDKFLKLSRLVKRRTMAQEIISLGAVRINRRNVKPSSTVREGDLIEIAYTSRVLSVRALITEDAVLKRKRGAIPYEVVEEKRVDPEEKPW